MGVVVVVVGPLTTMGVVVGPWTESTLTRFSARSSHLVKECPMFALRERCKPWCGQRGLVGHHGLCFNIPQT